MKHQELFDQIMAGGLRAWLDEQADARANAQRENLTRLSIGMGVAAAVAIGVMIFLPENREFGFFAGACVAAFAWMWAHQPIQKMVDKIKVRANEELGAALGLSFSPKGPPSEDFHEATRLGLLPANPDEADFADFWSGRFGNAQGVLHEAHLQEYQQQGKHRRLVTVFRGVVMGYDFARPFSSTTLVRPDQGIFNGIFNFATRMTGLKLEPVRMVHPDFEREFEIVSTDQVEARYLLHPAFCERLMAMQAAFFGRNLRMAFTQGRVIVVIETSDMFESGGIEASGDDARFAATIDQLGSLIDLTQTLNERPR